MLGFCENQKYIIYELCEYSLFSNLIANINKDIDNYINIKINWCLNIVEGMKYLTDLKFVHRDLAARNVLIDNKNVAKVSDFGMTKNLDNEIYKETQHIKLPLRWLAPEVYKDMIYNEKTDVWSCGITMIEIFSNGRLPYNNMSNEQVIDYVKDGNTLSCPECPSKFFTNVISECHKSFQNRYTFENLLVVITDYINNDKDNSIIDNHIPDIDTPVQPVYSSKPTRSEVIPTYSQIVVSDSPTNIPNTQGIITNLNRPYSVSPHTNNQVSNYSPEIVNQGDLGVRLPNLSKDEVNIDEELNNAINHTLDKTFNNQFDMPSLNPQFYSAIKNDIIIK